MSAFEELGVCPELIRAADDAGWLLPTPVQAEAVPLILGGGDVLAAAETGSGKTGAFGIPVLQIVHEALRDAAATRATGGPSAATTDEIADGAASVRVSVDDRSALFAVNNSPPDLPKGLALTQARSPAQWAGARATVGVAHGGRHHFEITVVDDGLVRCGWSTVAGSLDGLGTDSHSFGFGGTGKKSHGGAFETFGKPFGAGDVVGCSVDLERGVVNFSINGQDCSGLGSGDKSESAFSIPASMRGHALFPAVCLKNAECVVNFGHAPWAYPPPPGHDGVARADRKYVTMNDGPPRGSASTASSNGIKTNAANDAKTKGGAGNGGERRRTGRTPKAIVLEPARDLAEQTFNFFKSFATNLRDPTISAGLFVGGTDVGGDVKTLRDGCDVAVGTPGRIVDMVESGKLDVSNVRFFVLDEADRLLDSGNRGAILKLFDRMPKSGDGFVRLQVLLFSATLHSGDIEDLAARLCERPAWVDLRGKDSVPETVHHACVVVDPDERSTFDRCTFEDASGATLPPVPTDNAHAHDDVNEGDRSQSQSQNQSQNQNQNQNQNQKLAASQSVKRLKPLVLKRLIDAHRMDQALIFCRTNFDCDNVESFLNACGGGRGYRGKSEKGPENPYSCVVLGGARSMDERRRNLAAFKEGDVRFLICTDVAARGLDIKGLPFVVNVTLPDRSEDYVHRIGRVGRADTMGLAISIVSAVPERVWYCQKKGYKPWFNPSRADVKEHCVWYDEEKLLKDVEARIKAPVARIDPATLALPKELLRKLGREEGGAGAGDVGVYGKRVGGELNAEISAHLEAYAPSVKRLAELEVQAQASFWRLKRKFAG